MKEEESKNSSFYRHEVKDEKPTFFLIKLGNILFKMSVRNLTEEMITKAKTNMY